MFTRHKTHSVYRQTKTKILNSVVIAAMLVSSATGVAPLFWGNVASATTVGITYPTDSITIEDGESVIITGNAHDSSKHVANVYSGTPCTGTPVATTGEFTTQDFAIEVTGLAVGTHNLYVTLTKYKGNGDVHSVELNCFDLPSIIVNEASAPSPSEAPDMPVHLSPLNNSIQSYNDFYFDWTDVDSAVEYEFQASTNPATDGDGALTTGVWNNKLHGAPDRDFLSNSTIHSYGANGTWYWQVRAIDDSSNTSGWTTPWKMTIDMTAPTAPVITFPSAEQAFNTSPILNQWTVSTDANGIANYQIAYNYDDGHSFGSSTCPGVTMGGYSGFIGCRDLTGTQRNHSPNTSEQGGVTIWVRAQDNAGNWSAWSSPVHYYYDATAPDAPTLTSPADGVPVNGSDPIANDWEDVAGAHHYIYESYNVDSNGECIMSPIRFNSTYTDSKTNSRVLADGLKFCWRVKAVDTAGNVSPWSDLWLTIADNVAPVVAITSPTDGDLLSGSVNLAGTVDDDNPMNSYFHIEKADGTFVASSLHTNGQILHEFTWDTTGVDDGEYKIFFEARDQAGNKDGTRDAPGDSVVVITVTVDNTPPEVDITGFGQSANVIQPNVTATDPSTPLTYSWSTNAGVTVSNTSALNPTFTVAVDGTYTFNLTVTDAAGNSATVPFTFSYTTPPAPTPENPTPPPAFTNVQTATTNTPPEPGPLVDDLGGTTDPEVLSTSTTVPGNVEGADTAAETAASTSKFLGLGWWWLGVLGGLGIFWLLFFARRSSEDEN